MWPPPFDDPRSFFWTDHHGTQLHGAFVAKSAPELSAATKVAHPDQYRSIGFALSFHLQPTAVNGSQANNKLKHACIPCG